MQIGIADTGVEQMSKRNLPRSIANITNLDAFIKNNQHFYDRFIYGFQQERSISADIAMAFSHTIEMKLLFYMRTFDFHHAIDMDIQFLLEKFMRAEIPMTIEGEIGSALIKEMRQEILHSLNTKINVALRKILRPDDIPMSFLVGTIDRGKAIADIQDFHISDIETLTIDELCAGFTGTQVGFRIGLVKSLRIVDIQHLTIAQIQNRTIEGICFTRVH